MGLLPSAKGKSLERAAGGRQQRLGGRYAGQQRGLRGPPPPPSPTAHLPGHAQLPALCPPPCSRYVRLPSHEVPHSSSGCPCRPPSCLPRLSPTCHPFPLPQLPCRGHSNRLLQNFLWLPALLAWERGGGSPPSFSHLHLSHFLSIMSLASFVDTPTCLNVASPPVTALRAQCLYAQPWFREMLHHP